MRLSWVDRTALSLAPRWGLRRLNARHAAEVLVRHYEAASGGRRTTGWARNFGDADANVRGALVELRMHARDLLRNNAWALNGQRVIADNTVGWGIRPKAVCDDPAAASAADALWKTWAECTDCEAEGRHTFYGLQHLAMRSIVESGEVLFRRRPQRSSSGLAIPLRLQVLEADFLDHSKNYPTSDSGGPIIQGVEYDKAGTRAGYWLFEVHPGSGRNIKASKLIPASDIIHVAYAKRPGQTRGISWLAAAIVNLKDFDEYEDATLMRQKIAACFAAFVTDMDGLGTPLGNPSTDPQQPLVETFEPGMIAKLPPGKSVVFGNPPAVTDDSFSTRTLRRIAKALGVTYEDLTGDYSQVNFSSARMGRQAHYAHVNNWRWNMLIPLFCDGVWAWAMDAAVLAGALPEAPCAQWTPPPIPMLEPDKEGLALQRMVRTGAMTHAEMVREQGYDPDAHWAEYAGGLKQLDALGIKLDSDVRAVTAAGLAQVDPSAEGAAASNSNGGKPQ